MLSSGMFARHQPPAPALRRGRALCVDPRSFPEKSLLCFHTLAHSFIFRIQHFSLQALCFQSLPHSFYRNGGGGVLFPHPEGDADPEKRSAEGRLKFCLWEFVSCPFRLPLSAAAFGSLRVFA